MPTKAHRNTTPTHATHALVASAHDPSRPVEVSPDWIRNRAYEIYAQRCQDGRSGDELSDWIQAERELAKQGNATA